MKIRTRLAIAFLTITVVPITLIYLAIMSLHEYQGKMFSETYGLEEQVDLASGASIRVFSRLTESIQMEIDQMLKHDPEKFHDRTYLDKMNTNLAKAHSFLILLDGQELVYTGNQAMTYNLATEIRNFEDLGETASWGNYLDDNTEHLIKQRGFHFADDSEGTILLVTNVVEVIPEVKSMFVEMLVASGIILILTAAVMVAWVYRSIWKPLGQLQEATKQIRDGNLDFTLDVEDDDEIGQLCQNFEEMRIRLKETTEEKIQYDKESKELISNISHDLKTPITAIKGYAEGILDGVASSPEN